MSGEPLRRQVRIRNPSGLHLRPIAAFVETAGRFQSQVTVVHGERRADGRRMMELMLLGAECGVEVTLEVAGPDAAEALEALSERLAAPEPPPG